MSEHQAQGMVERVARAIAAAMCPVEGYAGTSNEALARAAIEAMREPTEAMVEAGWIMVSIGHPEQSNLGRGTEEACWEAMINESLKDGI